MNVKNMMKQQIENICEVGGILLGTSTGLAGSIGIIAVPGLLNAPEIVQQSSIVVGIVSLGILPGLGFLTGQDLGIGCAERTIRTISSVKKLAFS